MFVIQTGPKDRRKVVPLSSSVLIKRFRKVCDKVGIKNFRWHDVRHTTASYLAQNGASLVEIGSVLGHQSPSVTAPYTHFVADRPVTAHAALDKMLGGETPKELPISKRQSRDRYLSG